MAYNKPCCLTTTLFHIILPLTAEIIMRAFIKEHLNKIEDVFSTAGCHAACYRRTNEMCMIKHTITDNRQKCILYHLKNIISFRT